jgi:hypothetical protein
MERASVPTRKKKAEHECPARCEGSTFKGERGERQWEETPAAAQM